MAVADHPIVQQPTVELTADPRFARRIIRLALTSALALGLIWWLSARTLNAHPAVSISLGAGWLLMPLVLVLSLRWPKLRYALVVPSFLVGLALVAVCTSALPEERVASAGWLLITGGVLLGGVLGAWFWFRWLPVPARLVDPFAPGRWVLVATHVSLITAGLALVGLSVLT